MAQVTRAAIRPTRLRSDMMAVPEAGKAFNSKKAPDSDSSSMDQIQENVKFTTQDGSSIDLPMSYSLFQSHMILRPMSSSLSEKFGLKDMATPLLKLLLGTVKREMPDIFPNPFAEQVASQK